MKCFVFGDGNGACVMRVCMSVIGLGDGGVWWSLALAQQRLRTRRNTTLQVGRTCVCVCVCRHSKMYTQRTTRGAATHWHTTNFGAHKYIKPCFASSKNVTCSFARTRIRKHTDRNCVLIENKQCVEKGFY